MEWIYNKAFMMENQILFYIYVFLIILMILITAWLVYKEVKKESGN